MRCLVAICWLILWTTNVTAAPVQVRTGEHADFTRVVVSIPDGADWRFGRTIEGYALQLSVTEGYDLQRFFDLIPRRRIENVTQNIEAGELRLEVSCPCNAQAYLFRPNVIVIDVRDGLPRRISSAELSIDPPRLAVANDPPKDPDLPYAISRSGLLPIIFSGSVERKVNQPPSKNEQVAVVDQILALPSDQSADEASDDVRLLERSIVEGLSRALTDGLLNSELQQPRTVFDSAPDRRVAGQNFPGIATRTSIDPRAIPSLEASDQTQSGQACLPDSYFDVASWGDGRPFFDQLADARRALVPEFEDTDAEAFVALARLYVHFGFGREAEQTLDLEGAQSLDRQYLRAMAAIVDNNSQASSLFKEQISCPGQVSLWSMLAMQPFDAQVDVSAVLRTFRLLPRSLQSVLSPRLSERLLSMGAEDAALQILNATREKYSTGVNRVLADAGLLEALGERQEAVAVVSVTARTDPQATPELMIRFVRDGVETGRSFSEDDFLLMDAMRFEQSQTQIGLELSIAQIEAYLSVGRFEDALRQLRQIEADVEPARKSKLLDDIFTGASGQMSGAEFLRIAIAQDGKVLGATVRNGVAARLLDMGFPKLAASFEETELAFEALRDQPTEGSQLIKEDVAVDELASEILRGSETTAGSGLSISTDDQSPPVLTPQEKATESWAFDPQRPLTESRALLESSVQSRAALEELLGRPDVQDSF